MNQDQYLETLNGVRLALEKAQTAHQVIKIKGTVEALHYWAKSQKMALADINLAVLHRLFCQHRLGEMLQKGLENGDRDRTGGDRKSSSQAARMIRPATLKEIGVTYSESSRCQRILGLQRDELVALVDEATATRREASTAMAINALDARDRTKQRDADRERVKRFPAEVLAPGETAPTIVLDPPWDYRDVAAFERSKSMRPSYSQMTLEEIADLPVPEVAEQNAHLYLWVPQLFVDAGFHLILGWGFRPRNLFTWLKDNVLCGHYFGINTEHVWFAVRGSLKTKTHEYTTGFCSEHPGEHSNKPIFFDELVEDSSPGPWVYFFPGPTRRPGWKYWGGREPNNKEAA